MASTYLRSPCPKAVPHLVKDFILEFDDETTALVSPEVNPPVRPHFHLAHIHALHPRIFTASSLIPSISTYMQSTTCVDRYLRLFWASNPSVKAPSLLGLAVRATC